MPFQNRSQCEEEEHPDKENKKNKASHSYFDYKGVKYNKLKKSIMEVNVLIDKSLFFLNNL
jgi:hypothetical protein